MDKNVTIPPVHTEERKNVNFTPGIKDDKLRVYALSFSQQQMWVIDRLQPGNHAYNLSVGFRLKGKLDTGILEYSFNEIIKRHEILRTSFEILKEQPVQIVHPESAVKIKIIDLGKTPGDKKEFLAEQTATEEAVRPFNLSLLPLMRVALLKLEADENILVMTIHHIAADGWSLRLLFSELSDIYNSRLNFISPQLPVLPVQYSDYVKWQQEKNWKPSYDEQLEYWKKQLSGNLPDIELPVDKQRPPVQSLNGRNEFFFLPKDLTRKVTSVGIKNGCTFFMTMMAAFQAFLYRYSCGEHIVVGTPVSNRPLKEHENLVGNFLNTLAIRGELGDDPDFTALLRRTQKIIIEALTNRDFPFEKIVEQLKIKRDMSRNPVFQVMLQVLPKYSFNIPGLQISGFKFDLGYSQFDLSLHLYETEDGYQCRMEYDTDLFEYATIKRMTANFSNFLNELTENSSRRISEIPILHPEEKKLLLESWNNTAADIPEDANVADLFENKVLEYGDKPAIQHAKTILTYNELSRRSNQVANYLLKSSLPAGSLIGICIERSADIAAVMMGILKSGGAYLPLDPSFPAERLRFIIEDAGISILITQDNLVDIFPGFKGRLIRLDKEWDAVKRENESRPSVKIRHSDLAYTIYTSGSSGKPKGVLIEHGSLVNFLLSMQKSPGITDKDVLLAVTTISFDISVLEIFLPLITGAKVIIAGKNDVLEGHFLTGIIKKENVTIMQATPSGWKLMIDAGWEETPGLKMLVGGEAVPRDLANKMLERGKELWNMYGPTETTVWSSVNKIEPGEGPVLIGYPIINTQFYIVNKNDQLVPTGVSGELLIGGKGVARGYLNRQDLTETRFIRNPFITSQGRLYRTGDLVRCHEDGSIEFLGRTDFQVKLRGYRIEPGEIEHVLMLYDDVKEAVVVLYQRGSDKQLAAYLVTKGQLNLTGLRSFLKERLPDYMIPSLFVRLEKFPLTPNGKIDRKALPEPEQDIIEKSSAYEAPVNELEKKIAAIWEKVLNIDKAGRNDNFFEVGGHSLLAVQMFTELERSAGIKLPLVTLFEHQTIRGLAEVIKSGSWKEKWSSLIKIKQGTGIPLFLVHGAEGNILLYKELANYLAEDMPFYALQSRGLNGSDSFNKSIEQMASSYIREIQKVQQKGPYNLGGYCMGGTIAYEMAQQLRRRGEEVRNIFLIETYNICSPGGHSTNKMTYKDKLENLKFHYDNLRLLNTEDKIKFIRNKTEIFKRRIISRFSDILNKIGFHVEDTTENIKSTFRIRAINDKAQEKYTPKNYTGKVVLLKPKVNYTSEPDPAFGWQNLIEGDFKIYSMEVSPRGMLYEPFVKETAEIICKEMG